MSAVAHAYFVMLCEGVSFAEVSIQDEDMDSPLDSKFDDPPKNTNNFVALVSGLECELSCICMFEVDSNSKKQPIQEFRIQLVQNR